MSDGYRQEDIPAVLDWAAHLPDGALTQIRIRTRQPSALLGPVRGEPAYTDGEWLYERE